MKTILTLLMSVIACYVHAQEEISKHEPTAADIQAANAAPLGRSEDAAGDTLRTAIDQLTQPLLDRGYAQCVVIGVLRDGKRTVIGYGGGANDSAIHYEDMVFEIGSVTKHFTAMLLADLFREGTLQPDMPVKDLYPEIPEFAKGDKAAITLYHLAKHRSGLPRDAPPVVVVDPRLPFADFTANDLYRFMAECELHYKPAVKYSYSNIGYDLLGDAVARVTKSTYVDLMRARVLNPLGLTNTFFVLPPEQTHRLVPGHDSNGDETPAWTWQKNSPGMAAGALKSTADDMFKVMEAWSDPIASGLAPLFKSLAEELDLGKGGVLAHSGQTTGYHTMFYASRNSKTGLIVLADTGSMYFSALGSKILEFLKSGKLEPIQLPDPAEQPVGINHEWLGIYEVPTHPLFLPRTVLVIEQNGENLTFTIRADTFTSIAQNLYPKSTGGYFDKATDMELVFGNGYLEIVPGSHFTRNGELLFMRFIYFECDGNHNDTTLVNSYSINPADFRRLSQWTMPNRPTNAYEVPSKSDLLVGLPT